MLSEAVVVSKRVGLDLTGKLVTIRGTRTDWSGSVTKFGHKFDDQFQARTGGSFTNSTEAHKGAKVLN